MIRTGVRFAARALALVCACSSPGSRTTGRGVVPTAVLDPAPGDAGVGADASPGHYVLGPGSFPVPDDARPVESSTDANDYTFKIPRPQNEVVGQLHADLAALGFSIDDEYIAPSGSTHWAITRGAKSYGVTVAGKLSDTLLIVTVE